MIDQQYCIHCSEKKDKVFSHLKGTKRVYKDLQGRDWHGSRCPDCYASYKKNYDAARRIKKGHMPLGTICVCEKCADQFELTVGHHSKLCVRCRS